MFSLATSLRCRRFKNKLAARKSRSEKENERRRLEEACEQEEQRRHHLLQQQAVARKAHRRAIETNEQLWVHPSLSVHVYILGYLQIMNTLLSYVSNEGHHRSGVAMWLQHTQACTHTLHIQYMYAHACACVHDDDDKFCSGKCMHRA